WILFKIMRMGLGIWAVLRTPADLYHAQDITALPACYLAALLRRKLLIYDAHELTLADGNVDRIPILRPLTTILLKRMVRRCDAVITVSGSIAHELQQRYGGPTPVLVRNMQPYRAPVATTDRLRRELHLSPDERVALYQGTLGPDRSLDVLVRAAQYLAPGHKIVLLGDGPIRQELEALIAQQGVADRVRLLPAVPNAELLDWTVSADVGLIVYNADYSLNVRYCLPNKLFEYMMAGVPVVSTPLVEVGAIIERYAVGAVLPSLDPMQVGNGISAVLADAPALQRLRDRALAASATALCWEIESQQLIDLYQQLLGTPLRAHVPVPVATGGHLAVTEQAIEPR